MTQLLPVSSPPGVHVPSVAAPVIYPESDGRPTSDNSKQLRWIFALYGNLAGKYRDDADVWVGGDMLWYPVEGDPQLRVAPDVFAAFGRPKGDRGSYTQWEETNIPMTVVFEILSPSNTVEEMADKHAFYEEYGVEEYYIYNPDTNHLMAYVRRGEALRRIRLVDHYVSPRLGIRFELTDPEMTVFLPDGEPFLTFEELVAARQAEKRRADAAEERVSKLTRMVELSRKARQQKASPEELAELDRLENENLLQG